MFFRYGAAEDKLMILFSGPCLSVADKVLSDALGKHLKDPSLWFTVKTNIFRTSGITASKILLSKNKTATVQINNKQTIIFT